MATYSELLQAAENSTLRNKVRVAVVLAAEVVRTEDPATPNHAARLTWAREAFRNPDSVVLPMLWAVLAQNQSATLAQIIGASDAAVQTAVNNAVAVFAS